VVTVRLFSFLLTLLYVVAAVATIVTAFQASYAKTTTEGQIAVVGVLFLAGLLLVIAVGQQVYLGRRARYAAILPALNRIHSELQLSSAGSMSLDAIRASCAGVANELAGILLQTTGRECAACIKVVASERKGKSGEPNRVRAITLCRSRGSEGREVASKKAPHWIDQNTDFEELFAAPNRSFFQNCLPSLRDYKNSSFAVYRQPPAVNFPVLGDIIRYVRWPLPYRSTIVSAILPSPTAVEGSKAVRSVVGYLCVDSRSGWAFQQLDLNLVIGLAQSLYNTVHVYQKKRNEGLRGRIK
jgi:hypothetical protein